MNPDSPLAEQAAAAIDAVEAAQRSEDIAAGLSPLWARRSLHPWELTARVSFAAIDDAEERTTAAVARRLADDRRAFTVLLLADLARRATGRAAVDRLAELEVAGLAQVPGSAELLNATATDVRTVLEAHALAAAAQAAGEAAAQGIPVAVPTVLDQATLDQLDQLAHRLAIAPQVDVVRALASEAVRLPTPGTALELVDELGPVAEGLSDNVLAGHARGAAAQADGMGRQLTAVTTPPPVIYASELLDGSTCGPCSLIDGHVYDSLAAARADYPNGIYVRCEGGSRCRGTLVFVWNTEATPGTG